MSLPNYTVWSETLTPGDTQSNNPFDLAFWRYTLYSHWTSSFATTTTLGNETELHSGTDVLFRLAFQQQNWWHTFK
jgi:hypothetical protein